MWIDQLFRRLRFLLDRQNEWEDLETEMNLHRELRAKQMQRKGATPADAVLAVNRRFGNATLLKEKSNDMWGWNWLEDIGKDVRYVCRNLQNNLLFATVAVLTIALGIGANTAIFSIKMGRAVIALQVALCLTLIVGASLLVSTLRNLESQNLGLRVSGLLVFGVDPQPKIHSDAQAIQFYTALLNRLRALPGVEAVTLMSNRLGSGWSNNTNAYLDGRNPRDLSPGIGSNMMRWNSVGPDYFKTLGIPILAGRDFTDADSPSSAKVAVVNQTFVQRFLGGREALGHQTSYTPKNGYTIVGVAGNSKYTGVREEEIPMIYFPFTQVGDIGDMHIELRTAGDPLRFLPEVRKAVTSFAPDLALLQPMTQKAQFDSSIDLERLIARLSFFFGLLAVVLVMTGLYGTIAYSVNRRTSEFGIRMAIGAQKRQVLWLILRESFAICLVGVLIGLPLALASTRLLGSLLYGLTPHDPFILFSATLSIVVVCLLAGLIPARRAASVDPVVALRYE